jgi:hypothetical protein
MTVAQVHHHTTNGIAEHFPGVNGGAAAVAVAHHLVDRDMGKQLG